MNRPNHSEMFPKYHKTGVTRSGMTPVSFFLLYSSVFIPGLNTLTVNENVLP